MAWTTAYGQLTPSQDAYTNTADPTTNYGAKTLLYVESASQTTYIQFNLSSIPAGYTSADITKASLKLYVNAVTAAGSFNVDYVNGTWSESTITASNAPALGTTIASSVPLTTADKNQYILIDITAAVQAWLSGTANDGIALVGNSPLDASFDSKESTTTSHSAELDIVFASGGTLTGVTTASGSGLTGGGTSGTLNLSLTNACAANQVLQWNGSSWICASAGTGTIMGVTAGTDLTGGGTSGNVTLSLNTAATNNLYAQLAANNTFNGTQAINNTVTIAGTNGAGVLQVTNFTTSSSPAPGIVGTTAGTNASGVKGVASATTGTSNGVYGTSSSADGYGVRGTSPNVGVYGQSSGPSKEGQLQGYGAGVWGDTGEAYEGVLGTADDNGAGAFFNNAPYDGLYAGDNATIYAENDSSTGYVLVTSDSNNSSGCNIDVSGNLSCSGTVSGVAKVDGGARSVALYAVQSPENWFEDFGTGTMVNGAASVALDPTFAQTVNTTTDYHVFLTPRGECEGLYIANLTPAGFEVRELHHGSSSVAFDYRIVAKRNGYENVRLADVTEQFNKQETRRKMRRPVRPSAKPEVGPPMPRKQLKAASQALAAQPR
jgi:hypothetical protein